METLVTAVEKLLTSTTCTCGLISSNSSYHVEVNGDMSPRMRASENEGVWGHHACVQGLLPWTHDAVNDGICCYCNGFQIVTKV